MVFHVLAGNLFLSGFDSMIMGSLCGACNLVRCSAADRVFPELWRQAVQAVDPDFSRTISTAWWKHEEYSSTRAAAETADAVVAFGDDSSVAAVRALSPSGCRFVAHASRISFAVISSGCVKGRNAGDLAKRLAYDLSVYDQQGCLSPRGVFIETDNPDALQDFAEMLCAEMRKLAHRLPPHALSLEEGTDLARVRDYARIEQAAATCAAGVPHGLPSRKRMRATPTARFGARCFSAIDDPFVVTLRPSPGYQPGSMNRFCDLRWFSSDEMLEAALAPFRGSVSTLGVAGSTGRWQVLAERLRASRICPIGSMQNPRFGWAHDGILPLPALVSLLDDTEAG
jgi:hypothetical protein